MGGWSIREQRAGRPSPRLGGSPAPHEPLLCLGGPGKKTPACEEGGGGRAQGRGLCPFPGGGGGDPGLGRAGLCPSGLHTAAWGDGRGWADCVRQTIIDPPLVYPWCLISIHSSLKELAVDPGSLHPLSPWPWSSLGALGSGGRRGSSESLICSWDAAPAHRGSGGGLVVYVPLHDRGKGLPDEEMPSDRVLSLGPAWGGREQSQSHARSGLRSNRARGLTPPLPSGRDGSCVWCVCLCTLGCMCAPV